MVSGRCWHLSAAWRTIFSNLHERRRIRPTRGGFMDPITVTIDEAKRVSGLGHTTVFKLIGEGKLDTVKVGRRTLVKMDSLRQLLAVA
jgi:excisionase family DNA binding protein